MDPNKNIPPPQLDEIVRGKNAWHTCDGGVRGLVYTPEEVKELSRVKHKNYWKIGAAVVGGIAVVATSLLFYLIPFYEKELYNHREVFKKIEKIMEEKKQRNPEERYRGRVLKQLTLEKVVSKIDDFLDSFCTMGSFDDDILYCFVGSCFIDDCGGCIPTEPSNKESTHHITYHTIEDVSSYMKRYVYFPTLKKDNLSSNNWQPALEVVTTENKYKIGSFSEGIPTLLGLDKTKYQEHYETEAYEKKLSKLLLPKNFLPLLGIDAKYSEDLDYRDIQEYKFIQNCIFKDVGFRQFLFTLNLNTYNKTIEISFMGNETHFIKRLADNTHQYNFYETSGTQGDCNAHPEEILLSWKSEKNTYSFTGDIDNAYFMKCWDSWYAGECDYRAGREQICKENFPDQGSHEKNRKKIVDELTDLLRTYIYYTHKDSKMNVKKKK